MIIGTILVVVGGIFVGYGIKGVPKGLEEDIVDKKDKPKFKSMINPALCGYGDFRYGLGLLICVFLYYFLIVGLFSPFQFFFAFAIEAPVHFSKPEASTLLTMFFACELASRLICTVLARFVPINIFVVVNVLLVLATCTIMAIFVHYVREVLWACMAILGLLSSPLWPNGTAWADEYLQMNSMAVMVMMIGKSCGFFIFTPLVGQVFDVRPRNAMLVLVGCAATLVLLTGAMNVVIRHHKKKQIIINNNDDIGSVVVPDVNVSLISDSEDTKTNL
jgi:FHS family Na+ dependent glucose MFS transporter 1